MLQIAVDFFYMEWIFVECLHEVVDFLPFFSIFFGHQRGNTV